MSLRYLSNTFYETWIYSGHPSNNNLRHLFQRNSQQNSLSKYPSTILQLRLDFVSNLLYLAAKPINDIIKTAFREDVKPLQLIVATKYSMLCVSRYPDQLAFRDGVSFSFDLYFSRAIKDVVNFCLRVTMKC